MTSPATAAAPTAATGEDEDEEQFSFDPAFQTKIAALVLRDPVFMNRCESIIDPAYFENAAEASLVSLGALYWKTYRRCPDPITLSKLIKDAVTNKVIRSDLVGPVKEAFIATQKADIGDRDYVIDQVSDFARHQAVEQAIIKSVELLSSGKFADIEKMMKKAMEVGAAADLGAYDYFEEIGSRTKERIAIAAGTIKHNGISSGIPELDAELHQKGWGRRELSLLMGAAKAGKSMGLGEFGKNASLAGHNVLYVTLEVAAKIIAGRLDAALADFCVRELGDNPREVEKRIAELHAKAGKFIIHEFPTGTMKPSDLRRLIQSYAAKGIKFDLVVVDYADIMAPEYRSNDPIENSKSIYVDLRAIAQQEDVALLSATQTNREGAKAAVAKMTDVAEDFNKIRIADVVISINATDAEKAIGEARLYFAASRNQADGFTLRIKQERSKMKFIVKVLGKE